MKAGLDTQTAAVVNRLSDALLSIGTAIVRVADSLDANTAAIEEANRQRDDLMNGPRG
ncbi:hypothetical protein BI023_gp42 [Mycobacterium phage Sneeze]|uniref:Uncharacterized protein n=1 Tax=Mycobacterium phage Rabbs TaxID=2530143 RepID=A0A481VSC6_9CAUD|nr:hypothetical protein BI023_gp42 [Mycobacterium phage Sneeze]YP_010051387.1 hypothetical protein KDW71_gp42 [Mycobacterium phage Rabbs]ANU79773.1 hypothetical protein SEA_SNEEZE_42 [Mycobacterium phage Sneeze]QBI96794.1 hypothetical protein SEA_RABBS_42 [Mycobacterium phage Rabbs]